MKYLALIALAGCLDLSEGPITSTAAQDLTSVNGLSLNGLSLNGLSLNGLSLNGLSLNGLSLNGLSTDAFTSWFEADPTTSSVLMSYIVKCAQPTGSALSWTDPATSVSYSWPGELGLAPGWTSGAAMTLTEQQVMTACLVAHANKYGVHVPIAVEGRTAAGTEIARDADELASYPLREAAWFGNVVNGDGLFVCLDHTPWLPQYSSPRACGFDMAVPDQVSPVCPPIVFTGLCSAICTPDATGTYYTSCTWNKQTYQPLVTRFQAASMYSCGDGVCEISESCGNGATASSCKADCGVCPTSSASPSSTSTKRSL